MKAEPETKIRVELQKLTSRNGSPINGEQGGEYQKRLDSFMQALDEYIEAKVEAKINAAKADLMREVRGLPAVMMHTPIGGVFNK